MEKQIHFVVDLFSPMTIFSMVTPSSKRFDVVDPWSIVVDRGRSFLTHADFPNSSPFFLRNLDVVDPR